MSFAILPTELQLRIIAESLTGSPSMSLFTSSLQRPKVDIKQALLLAQVSSAGRDFITSLLYKHVRVTTPSSLRQLEATLAQRPDLAALMTSIHLGAESELPMEGWPVTIGNEHGEWPHVRLITTLSERDEEQGRIPRWCKPGMDFNINRPLRTCRAVAVDRAISSAIIELDVEPWRREYSKFFEKIGARAWAARLYLLQAALDLYLMEMRRVEDAKGYDIVSWRTPKAERPPPAPFSQNCKDSTCGHYPRLELEKYTSSKPKKGGQSAARQAAPNGDFFVVTNTELWEHLTRRGGPADHFDNIVLFSRSKREALNMTKHEFHLVTNDLGGPHYTLFTNEEWLSMFGTEEENEEYFASLGDPDDDDYEEPESVSSDEEDWSHEDVDDVADRVEDLLDMGRSVLAKAANLNNLTVTSFFHRALPAIQSPEKLHTLSIGPKSRHWEDVFVDDLVAKMPNVKKLRIRGLMSSDDATKVAWGMPKLKTLLWEFVKDRGYSDKILEVVGRLQARRDQPPPASQKKRTKQAQKKSSKQFHQQEQEQRKVEIRLHPDHVRSVLSSAPSQEVGQAWRQGNPVEGTLHAVKIIKSPNLIVSKPPLWSDEDRMFVAQYAEGRKWWEKGMAGKE